MKRLLATTALVAMTVVPAFAQSENAEQAVTDVPETSGMSGTSTEAQADADVRMELGGVQISASELIGKTVYMPAEDAPDTGIPDAIDAPAGDWESIGTINDVIISTNDQIAAVSLDVGGFLGIGAKEVSTALDELKMVAEQDSEGEYFVIYTGNRASIESRDALDRQSLIDDGSSFFAQNAPATPTQGDATAGNEGEAAAPSYLTDQEQAALTTEELDGVAVYDGSGEHVGDISDFVLTEDGRVEEVIIDIGGFLGIGAKPVAVSFDDLELSRSENDLTHAFEARTEITTEEFNAMQAWNG